MNININQLPKKYRLMILDFLENPSRKRALELIHKTPLILFTANEYFSKSEIEEKLKEIIVADVEKKYIAEFLNYDICSLFDCKLSSLQFIIKYGSKSNCKIAKKINMENKLSHNCKK